MSSPLQGAPQVIVVGAGNWGRNLIRNFHELGALTAVAEPNHELQALLTSEYPQLTLLNDFDEALKHDAPALVIATPAPTHFELGLRALKAGKDLFIEKPMTLNSSDALKLTEYAEANKLILMTGHLLLYQNAIRWISNYLKSGEADQVLHVHTTRAKLGTARSFENAWWSFAPHDVSIVLEFLGNPKLKSVKASGSTFLQEGIHDSVHADLTFESGQTAHLHTTWYWPHNERRTIIITNKQMITYNEVDQSITIHNKSINSQLQNVDEGSRVVTGVADSQPLKTECQHFLDSITTRNTPRSDGRNGLAVVEILEQAQEALNEQN